MKHPLPKSALDYQRSGAPEGERNNALLNAACQWRDAGYDIHETAGDLGPRASTDGLGEAEIEATLRSAFNHPPREPVKFGGQREPLRYKVKLEGREIARAKPKTYQLEHSENFQLPAPIPDGARALLKAAFYPGEYICINEAQWADENDHSKGDKVSSDNGLTFAFENWMSKLDAINGDADQMLYGSADLGLFVCINPLKAEGRKDANVTALRHVLVEFDKISLEDQWQIIQKSKIPCTAVVYSGGKSLHAWVRVDAQTRAEYSERVQIIWDHFKAHELDEKNKNPSRLCRLANRSRLGKRQELLALNVGVKNFTEWQATLEIDGTGHQQDINELMAFIPENDPNCVLGNRWLCKGGSILWTGPSGVGKSSLAMQAAVMWAMGREFMGIKPMKKLKSVFCQAENDMGDLAEMLQGVCKGLGITANSDAFKDIKENIIFYRDTVHTGEQFTEVAARLIDKHSPDLFWGDPLLAYIGDDISQQRVCSHFLRSLLNPISERTGVVWMFLHHTGKPSQDPNSKKNWQSSDFGYLGIGSSELTNWARAVIAIQQVDPITFALILAKRGKRAGAKNYNGELATTIFLKHAEVGICWLPSDYAPPAKKEKGVKSEPTMKIVSPSQSAKDDKFISQILGLTYGEIKEFAKAYYGRSDTIVKEKIAQWIDSGKIIQREKKWHCNTEIKPLL